MSARTAAKVDENQERIVAALRGVGCSVAITSGVGNGFPDLVLGHVNPRTGHLENLLVEVKTKEGKLEKTQITFHALWRGQVCVVRSVREALQAIGAIDG